MQYAPGPSLPEKPVQVLEVFLLVLSRWLLAEEIWFTNTFQERVDTNHKVSDKVVIYSLIRQNCFFFCACVAGRTILLLIVCYCSR